MWLTRIAPLFALLPLLVFTSCSEQSPQGNATFSSEELTRLAAEARTKADHDALANYFRQEAEESRGRQKFHEKLVAGYGRAKPPFNHPAYEHCQTIADSYGVAAENAEALAHIHEEFAKISPEQ